MGCEELKEKKESLLEKIKKLLNMANDGRGNTNESQAALLKAQKLMAENGISHTDIQMGINSEIEVTDSSIMGFKNLVWWHRSLGKIICDNFKCFCYINQRRNGYNELLKSVNFVGFDEDVIVAKEIFYYAIMMIEYHTEIYIINFKLSNMDVKNSKSIQNSFIQGYLRGLINKFDEQKEQNKKEWGLVLVRDKKVDDYTNNLNLKKSDMKIRTNKDMAHYKKGFDEGKKFNIIKGVLE
jgi:hypothetical protein